MYGNVLVYKSRNLPSLRSFASIVRDKLSRELELGRIAGPFTDQPFPSLVVSPLGIIPKKESGMFWLIHNLSFPAGASINDHIPREWCAVRYALFDRAVELVRQTGHRAWMAKVDIESAFCLLLVHPSAFPLLGFRSEDRFYFDKCMPMGCSVSCAYFEKFSTFLHWALVQKVGCAYVVHYLDDFLFVGIAQPEECQELLNSFVELSQELGMPLAAGKTEGLAMRLPFFGSRAGFEGDGSSSSAGKGVEIEDAGG